MVKLTKMKRKVEVALSLMEAGLAEDNPEKITQGKQLLETITDPYNLNQHLRIFKSNLREASVVIHNALVPFYTKSQAMDKAKVAEGIAEIRKREKDIRNLEIVLTTFLRQEGEN